MLLAPEKVIKIFPGLLKTCWYLLVSLNGDVISLREPSRIMELQDSTIWKRSMFKMFSFWNTKQLMVNNRHTVALARIELMQTCMHCSDDIHGNKERCYFYQQQIQHQHLRTYTRTYRRWRSSCSRDPDIYHHYTYLDRCQEYSWLHDNLANSNECL